LRIGIPKETREHERRVALTPSAVQTLVQAGHEVYVESGAGAPAGHSDTHYESAGALIVFDRMESLLRPELLACVYPPSSEELASLPAGQTVFAFWGLPAARPEDVATLIDRGVSAVGLEAIEDGEGNAPVLTAMSEIAGGLAVVVGSGLMLNEFGGRGILMGGAPGVPPAHFVVLGAGVLGRSAAQAALGMGAQVSMLDVSIDHLRHARCTLGPGLTTMLSTRPNIEKALSFADVVLGAVAVRGERAPLLVKREMLGLMRPRSIVIDLSIDMGGCFETARPTTFPQATYAVDGIIHFCVPNLPSVAARSATMALTNAQLPYITTVAREGLEQAVRRHPRLARGVYLHAGRCVRPSLARAHGLDCAPWPLPREAS